MIRGLLKLAAYRAAPRATFAVSHPRSAIRLKKVKWDMKHATAPRVAALGAAALALPIGYAAGKLMERRTRHPVSVPRPGPATVGARSATSPVSPQSPHSPAASQGVHES